MEPFALPESYPVKYDVRIELSLHNGDIRVCTVLAQFPVANSKTTLSEVGTALQRSIYEALCNALKLTDFGNES